jgi:hypothetical protein
MEENINAWFPYYLPMEETMCIACYLCSNCKGNCEMCLECNSKKRFNIYVEPFVPYEQIEEEFVQNNPWINE